MTTLTSSEKATRSLIRNKKTFNLGLMLGVTFLGVLVLIFMPIFGDGKNGLEFSDDLFNKLSKGSSYFIPKLEEKVKKVAGKSFSINIKMDKPEAAEKAVKILLASGAQVGVQDLQLKLSGDMGSLMGAVLKDSDTMYKDNGAEVKSRYGIEEKEVMALWWSVLTRMDKEFKKEKKIEESEVISEVVKKGVEPAYNFYGIPAQSVLDKAFTMTALLVFYVAYTMWWGYAIFYLFDGLGMSMKKSKVKKEV